jgi:predicted aspartyl protease
MEYILSKLPPEVAARVHPDWKRNEKAYWARRESLLRQYEGQWVGFADDAVIVSGERPVEVLHAAQRTGRHPFVTRVGHEDTPQRMRRSTYSYDSAYPGEPLPRVAVDFRTAPGGPGATFEDAIPDTGADASALPWADCQALQLDPEEGVPALMGGVGGSSAATVVWAAYATIDGVEYPCWLQADFAGDERIVGRDLLNQLEVLFRGPAREVVLNP